MREPAFRALPDPSFCARFLTTLPPDLAASFDRRQLFAIQQTFGSWSGAERRRGLRFVVATPWGRYACSIARADPRDRRAEALRGASARGALTALGCVAALLAGMWLLTGQGL